MEPPPQQQTRDAAYNNQAAVANSLELIAARNAASAAFRGAHPGHLDIPYGPKPANRWDLFPQDDGSAPCLVFIHGGYWQYNRREDFAAVAAGVYEHGWAAALPGYTLAPDACLTEIAAETRLALDWLAASSAAHGIGGPFILSGWSAGAQLAALLLDHPAIQAGLAISGVFELGPLRETYLDEKLRLTNREVEELSPLRRPPIPKPLKIAYGTRELPALIANSRDFHAMRAAAQCEGRLVPVTGADHFNILDTLQSPQGILTEQVLSLIG